MASHAGISGERLVFQNEFSQSGAVNESVLRVFLSATWKRKAVSLRDLVMKNPSESNGGLHVLRVRSSTPWTKVARW